jgi:tetratricopeptide (TPR) repeat protein
MATKPAEQKDLDIGQVYTRTELFLENNKKAVTIGVVGLLVVVGSALGWKSWVNSKQQEAMQNIWKAQYYFEIDSLDKAMNGDDAGNLGFIDLAQQYSSTPAGKLAHFYLGTCYMQKGEYESAIEEYKKADVDDDVLRVMAVGNTGDALVELGKMDEAAEYFEKAANMVTNDFTTPMYLMKAGIVHQQAGNWKAAAKAFGRVVREFPESQDVNQAKKYLGYAEQMAEKS